VGCGGFWRDIDQYGRLLRESRKLEDGRTIEVGRSTTEPDKWAPAPPLNAHDEPYPHQLFWRDTAGETGAPNSSGVRYVDGEGNWQDVFTDAAGGERIARRGLGTRVREYLAEHPQRNTAAEDPAGVWVDKNHRMQITGRRDHWGEHYIEAHGSPVQTTWRWRSYHQDQPNLCVAQGIRKQNRGSMFSPVWDDSYRDFNEHGEPVRERNATDRGDTWINAVPSARGTWTWQRVTADGTVHSSGVRIYDNFDQGHWRDTIDGTLVRFRGGRQLRELDYTMPDPRHPDAGVTVHDGVWKEFNIGKVFRERRLIDAERSLYREIDNQWHQWREYQHGSLTAVRTIDGRVWQTDAFGRWHTMSWAKIPNHASLPPVNEEHTVGLEGHRSWRLVGRELHYQGFAPEFRGHWRNLRDIWAVEWTGIRDGGSVSMPLWQREARMLLLNFFSSFVLNFLGTLMATAAENHGKISLQSVEKALFNGTVSGTIGSGITMLQDTTRLQKLKMGLSNMDWAHGFHTSLLYQTDPWATDIGIRLYPIRWRLATYVYFNNLVVGGASSLVYNSADAAIFGVNGHKRTGTQALLAGAWGTAATELLGVTTGLAQNVWHFAAAGRLYARGGIGDMVWAAGENTIQSYLGYEWESGHHTNITSARPFQSVPPPPTPGKPTTSPAPSSGSHS
ncbi:MAG: hypothetical protein JO362_04680, partial [Streptomycetaceae bacterium]|nr:hypothetical protein [Streptomycetaceae bacterium]